MSRLTSETNPEPGTTNYTYDTDTTCGTYTGDLVKKVDAVGNVTCAAYDALHRRTAITYPSGTYAPATPAKYFVYDAATVNAVAMTNVKGRLAEAYTCFSPCSSKTTDEGFSYTVRGEVSDVYQSTPHSGGYYHLNQTYWPHGLPSQLTQLVGLPTISYGGTIGTTVGLDGEGRITQVTASSGQNPMTGVSYNTASFPTQVNFGSADSDVFAYDANTLRMTQFQFNVGTPSLSLTSTLTWNANGTLGQLAITDPFNSADTQTCNYAHDDLTRLASANCGAAASQTFSYDAFGNISKSGSPYTFQPTYNTATNRFATIPGITPAYDANGNVTYDGSHNYAWDADGNSITLDGVGLTFDALDRMVEQTRGTSYTQIVYAPTGGKLALMNGQSLQKAFVPLPGRATAVYTSTGLDHYRHSDWLGSARLTSSPSGTYISSVAYAPFGETYAQSGATDLSFTSQNADTVSTDYDFLYREYSTQGRWASPDPAGLAAVDPSIPQSWNRYAYVRNNPMSLIDPLGLDHCNYYADNGVDVEERDRNSNPDECDANGGTWVLGSEPGQEQSYSSNSGAFPDSSLFVDCLVIIPFSVGCARPPKIEFISDRKLDRLGRADKRRRANSSGGGSTLDDRANALANALNKTGVQSLGNPCTVGAFYLASAAVGAATSGEVYAQGAEAAITYWPQALSQVSTWLYRQTLRGGPVANFILNVPKNYNKAKAAVLAGCNAMQ